MDDRERAELISFLRRSKNRKKILIFLHNGGMHTPTDIAHETGIHRSHVSNQLGELREEDLVEVLNPDDKHHRFYRITDKGEKAIEEVREREGSL